MKILLLVDRLNWAYHSIAKSLQKYNNSDIYMSIMHIKGNENQIKKAYKKFDRVLVMGWQTYERVKFIPQSIAMVGIHSHHSWDNRKTTPNKNINPPRSLINFLNRFLRVNAVSKRLYDLFKKNGINNIYYTPNGVDTEIFRSISGKSHDKFTVGYSGSKSHDWRKGISEFIIPSAKRAKVNIKIAMRNSDSYISLEQMPRFYQEIDCYICASLSEGFSLSTLESAACGCPVITTRVGGTSELIKDGYNGFLVDRRIEDISDKICTLKNDSALFMTMSKNMREFVENNYSWSKTTHAWIQFLTRESTL